MAAFDPATIALQRELLDKTNRDVARDERLLAKQPTNSRSKLAAVLRERIATGKRIIHDLTGLIRFMEGLNSEEPGEGGASACCLAAEQFEHDEDCELRIDPEDGTR